MFFKALGLSLVLLSAVSASSPEEESSRFDGFSLIDPPPSVPQTTQPLHDLHNEATRMLYASQLVYMFGRLVNATYTDYDMAKEALKESLMQETSDNSKEMEAVIKMVEPGSDVNEAILAGLRKLKEISKEPIVEEVTGILEAILPSDKGSNLNPANVIIDKLSTDILGEVFEKLREEEKQPPISFRDVVFWLSMFGEFLTKKGLADPFEMKLIEDIKGRDELESIWIEMFESWYQRTECVAGIVRDDNRRSYIVTFRGSVGKIFPSPADLGRDWVRNRQVGLADMEIPPVLNHAKNKTTVQVHQGFHEYLFNNTDKLGRSQMYNKLKNKLDSLLKENKNYNLYVAGHSLGGALATLASFKLSGTNDAWIPKPVRCITFGSPRVGTQEFRYAFSVLEKNNLIRYLRVSNQEDVVPAIPPVSWGKFPLKRYTHVGINLILYKKTKDPPAFVYAKDENGRRRALSNNILRKSLRDMTTYHGLNLTKARLDRDVALLNNRTIDELYQDTTIV